PGGGGRGGAPPRLAARRGVSVGHGRCAGTTAPALDRPPRRTAAGAARPSLPGEGAVALRPPAPATPTVPPALACSGSRPSAAPPGSAASTSSAPPRCT